MQPFFFIQARMGSTRLPGKVLAPLNADMKVIDCLYQKLSASSNFAPNRTVILTSVNPSDDPLVDYCVQQQWLVERGDEDNVFMRFYAACKKYNPEYFYRICADNPFVEPFLLDTLSDFIREHSDTDYVSFQDKDGCPVIQTHYGFFSELISARALLGVDVLSLDKTEQEHVTPVFYNHPDRFQVTLLPMPDNLSDDRIRLTIDTEEDLQIAKKILAHFRSEFNIMDVYHFLNCNPDLYDVMDKQIQRNQK